MKDETIKSNIFKKGLKSIPNVVWVICASYALIMITNLFVLNFAHIDADKHINRYLDIILSEKEGKQKPNTELRLKVSQLNRRLIQVEVRLREVGELAHKSNKRN